MSIYNRSNQKRRVLEHLQKVGDLTTLECIELYGIARPSNIMLELRKQYNIRTTMHDGVNRYGEPVRYGSYHYVGEKQDLREKLQSMNPINPNL